MRIVSILLLAMALRACDPAITTGVVRVTSFDDEGKMIGIDRYEFVVVFGGGVYGPGFEREHSQAEYLYH